MEYSNIENINLHPRAIKILESIDLRKPEYEEGDDTYYASLRAYGLVTYKMISGEIVPKIVNITDKGKAYLAYHPILKEKENWECIKTFFRCIFNFFKSS